MSGSLDKNALWGVLVEAVHSLPLYSSHRNYVKEIVLPQKPGIRPEELCERLNLPLGEAMVILEELSREAKKD